MPPNPFRASTGSMPIRTPHDHKHDEYCESCGSSYTDEHLLRINTPYSPRASGASLHPPSPHSGHCTHRNGGIEPGKVLTRYHNGALVLEPAHGHGERRRRSSISTPSAPRSHARRSWASYYQDIDITEEGMLRRGTTRFPRKLVNKDAVQQAGLAFEEERDGTIVIRRALPRAEIEHLVGLTESIRAQRNHSHSHHKHTEKHVRIIPGPTDTIQQHPEGSHRRHRRDSLPPPPQIVHHYAEDPRHSSHRLSRAEEEAVEAEEKARRKERRAEASGSWVDGRRAIKAREEAEEKARIAEEVARKEKRTREVVVVR